MGRESKREVVGGGEPFYFYIRGFFVPLAKATNLQQPLFDLFLLIYLTTPIPLPLSLAAPPRLLVKCIHPFFREITF